MTLGAECMVYGFVFGFFVCFVLWIFLFCTGIVQVYGITAAGVEWTGSPEHEQWDYFNVLQCSM